MPHNVKDYSGYKQRGGYYYADKETRELIDNIMTSMSAHFFLKDIIFDGLNKDCVDTLHNLRTAVKVFEGVCNR